MSEGNRKRRKALGLIPKREKCSARKTNGEPCGNYPIDGGLTCRIHGGAAPQVKRKAQERIALAQDDAASMLIRFMGDDNVPYPERRRIAEFLLTYENRNEVKLQLAKWEESLSEVFLDIDDDEIPVRLEPDADGVYAPEDPDARWEEMERRQPTGDPIKTPRARRTAAPRFADPDPPDYSRP
ncbi:hypothetical protein BHE97_18525 [Aeromicrobium sp. PE09-221]|uniref:hypothetical protein n=1 Tax=Aeromicrobium sp. PE09-221 TaxID=1898043 RepID=UPI000B3E63C1|nr:hypothetical protein [Aeromicrobium sp. PE09-221]OUZ06740.1 hypothetical protein BHE97_18525 [Aeromicrobium sp. PE09-221]